jgi:hypothetical protein
MQFVRSLGVPFAVFLDHRDPLAVSLLDESFMFRGGVTPNQLLHFLRRSRPTHRPVTHVRAVIVVENGLPLFCDVDDEHRFVRLDAECELR